MSVRLRTKWLWSRILLLSLKLQIWCLLWARSFLKFRHNIECGFTLKLLSDMITYSKKQSTYISGFYLLGGWASQKFAHSPTLKNSPQLTPPNQIFNFYPPTSWKVNPPPPPPLNNMFMLYVVVSAPVPFLF